jgi:hypothetical protein
MIEAINFSLPIEVPDVRFEVFVAVKIQVLGLDTT